MTDLAAVLSEMQFFEGLSQEHLGAIADCATAVEFGIGEMLFEEDGVADGWFIIIEGAVALELSVPGRGNHVIQTVHNGDVTGWSWLFPPYRWVFGAQALDPTQAIRFDAESLRQKQEADCNLGYELMSRFANVLAGRLQATRLQLLDVYGNRT
jgi:CRP/FNR family cyclic AMP-dependent transcriptional regulator